MYIHDVITPTLSRQFNEVFDDIRTSMFRDGSSKIKILKKNGVTTHYYDGMVSRLDGPAIIYDDDRPEEYWVEGKRISKHEHDDIRLTFEDQRQHEIWIDGKIKKVDGKKMRKIRELLE